jgi:hypothetical protein
MHVSLHIYIYTYLYNKKTEGTVGNSCISDCANNLRFSHLGLPYFTKQKNNQPDYYYPSTSSEGSRANEEETSDASESEATLTKAQGASA